MSLIAPDQVYKKFKTVAKTVKEDLKRKGMVIPVKFPNGNIKFENYIVEKQHSGFYNIKNNAGHVVVDQINLPQSAALLANKLALGKLIDVRIQTLDREYGYRLFERDVFKKNIAKNLKNKNADRAELLLVKFKIANEKVEKAKKEIVSSFEKLQSLH